MRKKHKRVSFAFCFSNKKRIILFMYLEVVRAVESICWHFFIQRKFIEYGLYFVVYYLYLNEIQKGPTIIRQLAIEPVAFQEPQRKNESFPYTLKPQFHIYQRFL